MSASPDGQADEPEAAVRSLPLSALTSLRGSTAVVTGAAQGFGYAIALRLAEAGASVVIADRDRRAAEAAADRLRAALSIDARAVELDITDEAKVIEVFEQLEPFDILVNNAGVFSNYTLLNLSGAEFQRIMSVNVNGTFTCSQQFARLRVGAGRPGVIVNVASVDSLQPSCAGQVHYTSSKHAVAGLTKGLSVELAPKGIRVVAVCPGAALTEGAVALVQAGTPDGIDISQQWDGIVEHTPLGRLVTPDEIALAVTFLASPMASGITGTLLVVDGGITSQPLEGYGGLA
jgi:NAD(P)-dependent dehydrogenase (short-subunit alcohol dehydrogenase family)